MYRFTRRKRYDPDPTPCDNCRLFDGGEPESRWGYYGATPAVPCSCERVGREYVDEDGERRTWTDEDFQGVLDGVGGCEGE